VIAGNAGEQRLDLRFDGVIDPHRDPRAAARSHHLSGLVDSFRAVIGRRSASDAAAGAVHDGARLAERAGNTSARAAGGTCDDGDFSR
jgi:hypothetical protein